MASIAILLGTPARAAPNASQQLAAVLAAGDEADLDLIPQNALARGDLRRTAQFGDLISDDHRAKSEAAAREQLRQIRAVDRRALDAKERIAYDMFRYQAEVSIRLHTSGVAKLQQVLPIDHVFGNHVAFAQVSSGEGVAPYKTVDDFDNGLKRIDGYVQYLDRSIELMRRGLRSRQVQPRIVVEKVIAQLDAEIGAGIEGSPYLQPTKNYPAGFTAPDRSRFDAAYRKAVGEQILPALRRLASFMRGDYLPASRTGPPGLVALPGGASAYAIALEQHNTVRMSADEIHRLGLAEVARIRGEMQRIREQVGFVGPLPAFFQYLQTDDRFKFGSRDELLARYRAINQRVEAALPRLFSKLPKGRMEIRAMPKEQEASGGGAYYTIGTPDGERPGVFFVNASNLPTRTSPRMTALVLHETSPGHHLQGSLAQEDPSLPALLQFGFNTAYGEGWALYAEWLGNELGLYDDPYQHFGRLDMEMLRAVRLVVDSGLHARAWSRERAIRYMAENTSLDTNAIEQEIDRYTVWPGQATAYKVGEMFMRKLRARAEARLGSRFDVRAFHEQVLNTGMIPLAVLERKINEWITATAGRGARP